MQFYGYHGVLNQEKTIGQKYIVSVVLYLDLKDAGRSDKLEDTIDYSVIYKNIKEIVENKIYNLLEKLAEKISEELLEIDKIKKVKIKVEKPSVPIGGILKNAAVEIRRKKN